MQLLRNSVRGLLVIAVLADVIPASAQWKTDRETWERSYQERTVRRVYGSSQMIFDRGDINQTGWLQGTWQGSAMGNELNTYNITLSFRGDGTYAYKVRGECFLEHEGTVTVQALRVERTPDGPQPVAMVRFVPVRVREQPGDACDKAMRRRALLRNEPHTFEVKRRPGSVPRLSINDPEFEEGAYSWGLDLRR